MATPTTYSLSYDSPCDVEGNCGESPCGNRPEYVPRPQIFCLDALMLQDLTVSGDAFVRPNQIFVGGARYVPRTLVAKNGSFVVLARG